MSRPTMAGPGVRGGLSLTEELERLEQQITLTLQEIDSNFSKAHRIVTGSILPIVEQYAQHSGEVWEGSKFWKQFFEASANVSLSGYEEAAIAEEEGREGDDDVTHQTDTTSTALETPERRGQEGGAEEDDQTASGVDLDQSGHGDEEDGEDQSFSVESPTQVTGVQSTPKLSASASKQRDAAAGGSTRARAGFKSSAASFRSPSPRKYTGRNPLGMSTSSQHGPSTPKSATQRAPAADLQSSPFEPDSAVKPPPSTAQRSAHRQQPSNHDPLMHRGVLDKNYRIQATPHTQRRQRQQQASQGTKTTPQTATRTTRLWDDSPDSSPAVAAPQLRSDLFSPQKPSGPRTPGLSVLTPGRPQSGFKAPTTSTGKQLFSPDDKAFASATQRSRASHIFSEGGSSDDEDDSGGMSPPKTMQFHVPQSRLVQTPAREASRKIVEDLLMTAGADNTDDIERGDGRERQEEPSPSVVRRAFDVDEDTF
ncbi:hypothetical protein KC333_g4877 [Hortaea werneckii]|nr:hypothetical protein KC333_g4877 [Hortaea werneckii]KAI7314884.1 hypothetical protein KC326_g4924 [Hortaea werneckii]